MHCVSQRGPTAGPRANFGPRTITVISVITIGLNIEGISRFSSVTILQPDQVVLLTNLMFKLTFRSLLLLGSFFRMQ